MLTLSSRVKESASRRAAADNAQDPYFSRVLSLVTFNGNLNGVVGGAWSATGSTTVDGTPKFGSASVRFSANASYISQATNTATAKGTDDFTIEMWVKLNSYAQGAFWESAPMGTGGSRTAGFVWYLVPGTGQMGLFHSGSFHFSTANSLIPIGTWTHIALVRLGGTTKAYVAGTSVASTTNTITDTLGGRMLGYFCDSSGQYLDGVVDSFRETKGVGRYVENFTPPTTEFPVYGSTPPGDSYWGYTELLCPFDSSFTDVKLGIVPTTSGCSLTTGKFATNALLVSSYSDFVKYSSTNKLHLSNEDFCIEFWYKQTSSGFVAGANRNASAQWRVKSSGTELDFYVYSGPGFSGEHVLSTSGASLSSEYKHIAIARAGALTTIYINGVVKASGTSYDMYNGGSGTTQISIGYDSFFGNTPFLGAIDDFRLTKGASRYPVSFSPPTARFPNYKLDTSLDASGSIDDPYWSSVKMLVSGGAGAILDKTGNFPTVNAGTTTIPAGDSKFSNGAITSWFGYSASFSTQSHTIEFWTKSASYTSSGNGAHYIRSNSNGDNDNMSYLNNVLRVRFGADSANLSNYSSYAPVGQWHHIAKVYDAASNIGYVFVNGVKVIEVNLTSGWTIGGSTWQFCGAHDCPSPDRMEEIRVTIGVARYTTTFTPPTKRFYDIVNNGNNADYDFYAGSGTPSAWSNVKLASHFDTNANDISQNACSVEVGASASVDSSVKKFGAGAMRFLRNTASHVKYTSPGPVLTSTTFTVEMFFMYADFHGGSAPLIDFSYSSDFLQITYDSVSHQFSCGIVNASSITLSTGQWYHVALVKNGQSAKLFLDGNLIGTSSNAPSSGYNPTIVYLGTSNQYKANIGEHFDGWIDDLRITNGVALYTTSFTPPSSEFPNS